MKKIFLVTLCFVILGCGNFSTIMPDPTVTTDTGSPPTPIQVNETFQIDAQASTWVDTGITIHRSDALQITASGTVDFGGVESDPNGSSDIQPGSGLLPAAPYGALIGMIGSGDAFLVGRDYQGTARTEGNLKLMINDVPEQYGDNSGQFSVTVTINPPPQADRPVPTSTSSFVILPTSTPMDRPTIEAMEAYLGTRDFKASADFSCGDSPCHAYYNASVSLAIDLYDDGRVGFKFFNGSGTFADAHYKEYIDDFVLKFFGINVLDTINSTTDLARAFVGRSVTTNEPVDGYLVSVTNSSGSLDIHLLPSW